MAVFDFDKNEVVGFGAGQGVCDDSGLRVKEGLRLQAWTRQLGPKDGFECQGVVLGFKV